jgi:hypothetical protein
MFFHQLERIQIISLHRHQRSCILRRSIYQNTLRNLNNLAAPVKKGNCFRVMHTWRWRHLKNTIHGLSGALTSCSLLQREQITCHAEEKRKSSRCNITIYGYAREVIQTIRVRAKGIDNSICTNPQSKCVSVYETKETIYSWKLVYARFTHATDQLDLVSRNHVAVVVTDLQWVLQRANQRVNEWMKGWRVLEFCVNQLETQGRVIHQLMTRSEFLTLASLWQCLQSNTSPQHGALILHFLL